MKNIAIVALIGALAAMGAIMVACGGGDTPPANSPSSAAPPPSDTPADAGPATK
ncbi:MAG: hypothetical protein JOZ69_10775 [Myxococcales bacterium]|nr:hypothetical protein [Myxococcales bacterium]